MTRPAVYFDLETGGVEDRHPNIQIAAVAVDEDTWTELATFECKILFEPEKADPEALKLNHYSPEDWRTAIAPMDAAQEFAIFLRPFCSLQMTSKRTGRPYSVAKLAGHNAASFDGPRLKRMFQECKLFLPADPRVRCTCQLAMWHFDRVGVAPKDFKLTTLCQCFAIPVDNAHNALADVRMSIALARAIQAGSVANVAA